MATGQRADVLPMGMSHANLLFANIYHRDYLAALSIFLAAVDDEAAVGLLPLLLGDEIHDHRHSSVTLTRAPESRETGFSCRRCEVNLLNALSFIF